MCSFYLVIIIEEPLGEIPSENVVIAQGHKGASEGHPAEDVLNRVTVIDVSSGVLLSIFMY
jgi:hypothetical protein